MGVTIHYKGKINDTRLVDRFCEELRDIAADMSWEYSLLNNDVNLPNTSYINDEHQIMGYIPLKGVVINVHPKADTLSFLFDKKGSIRNIVSMTYEKDVEESYEFIKTQFAPVEIHISVIKLLKYLKKKYISNLEVQDEGSYWDTEDRELLTEKIDFLNGKINEIEGILNSIDTNMDDTGESVIEKIEDALKKYGNSVEIKRIDNNDISEEDT